MKAMIITLALTLTTMSLALAGCTQDEITEDDALGTTVTEQSSEADTTAVEPAEENPIDSLSIKRGINISTYEYVGANKELHLALRGGELSQTNIADIKAQGFDHVRLPVNFAGNYKDGRVNEEFYREIDKLLEMILAEGLTVVLDFHGWDDLKSDVKSNKQKFYDIWEEVAEHYKDYPNELLFEIFNEPYRMEGSDPLDAAKLNEIQAEAIKIIRKTNPKRILVAAGPEWNTWWGLKDLILPKDDPNLIVDVHTYQPLTFTHQGQELWMKQDPNFKSVAISDAVFNEIDVVISTCKQFTERTGIGTWLGEFGMVTAVPVGADLSDYFKAESKADFKIELVSPAKEEDVTAYFAYTTEKLEDAGIPWAVWEYDFEFGAYNSLKGEWRDFVMDGLMRTK